MLKKLTFIAITDVLHQWVLVLQAKNQEKQVLPKVTWEECVALAQLRKNVPLVTM